MTKRILFVFTSANQTLTGASTGWYLPEAAHPYYLLAPHFTIDFASPAGPNPPVDEYSVQTFPDDIGKFLKNSEVQKKLSATKKLSDVNPDDYDAIFYVGGHGPVLDLAVDPVNIKLASQFYRTGKLVAAVCHGPAALVGATDDSGKSIFAGKAFTGFSNVEEEQVDKVKDIPFLLEDKISSLGGKYEKAAEPWGPKVVVAGNLITGQNPASAHPIGEAILQALQK
ncbi:class I glutamine amidotransferase-like protein [Suillus plorans]|uniref:D-lactate dehydratase n=1 Tax=Suillus plorans TaxID=116603 RepID=A0A9P7DZV3_9AGAM|nr:class I glutamine amidotransferase-like protein [Suillus plorans]KAG1806867.1 class I glutamine amidotransferase-like protein [Suillus plorans]